MENARRTWSLTHLLALAMATSLATVYLFPGAVSRLTYAVETGKSVAAQQQLARVEDLSTAFKQVAKALRPSVVSIRSVQIVRARSGRSARPELPDELRRFFGDDFFDQLPQPDSQPRGFERQGTGSGVIVSHDGYILTNNHVVRDADEVTVKLSDGRELKAEVIGTDAATDIAVIKVHEDSLVPAKLGDSGKMEVGDWVVAIGSPFGLDQTVTVGIVSAKGRANVGITDYEDFLQTDAAINPGNSGGPLVNLRGQVIGINTAIASRTGGNMGVGFAIPSNMARRIMETLIENGHVQRGWLGAVIQNLDPDLAASFGYQGTDGVLIGDVVHGGPAEQAGLKSGDIVTRYDGKVVRDVNELRNAVAATKADTDATLTIFRDGKLQPVVVHIALRGDTPPLAGAARPAEVESLGMTVQTLTPTLQRQLGYDEAIQGALVTAVEPGSSAAAAGVQPRDIVVSINGKEVADATTFRRMLKESDLDQGIRLQLLRDGVRRFALLKKR